MATFVLNERKPAPSKPRGPASLRSMLEPTIWRSADSEQTAKAGLSSCACGAPGAVSDPCPGCRKVIAAASGMTGTKDSSGQLEVSSPVDATEREADAVADQIAGGLARAGAPARITTTIG